MANKNTFISTFDPLLPKKLNALSKAIEDVMEPFVINLSLSGVDGTALSGTMDKTVGEIYEAYKSGKRLQFSLGIEGLGHTVTELSNVGYADASEYPSFNVVTVDDRNLIHGTYSLVYAFTGITDYPEKNTWSGRIFPLTQPSN